MLGGEDGHSGGGGSEGSPTHSITVQSQLYVCQCQTLKHKSVFDQITQIS